MFDVPDDVISQSQSTTVPVFVMEIGATDAPDAVTTDVSMDTDIFVLYRIRDVNTHFEMSCLSLMVTMLVNFTLLKRPFVAPDVVTVPEIVVTPRSSPTIETLPTRITSSTYVPGIRNNTYALPVICALTASGICLNGDRKSVV